MNEADARRARGLASMKEVTGFEMQPEDAYQAFTVDNVFGEVWTRPGLTRKERRWIAITLASASGQAGAYVYHLRAALESGDITRDELMEWIVQFAHYAGWPASAGVYTEMRKLFAELDAAENE